MSVAEPESPVLKTPEWLEVLENKRKRPHRLAHDIGAGAPCLVCKDGCKGLNLHFWRKLCIECKCRKEDHEIQEEEDYAQFEILFGAKKVKRTTLKFNAQNKSFDWIPPNVPPELAVDYLKSIPQSKLPISNSEGARYRKQQLEKQLPLHDVDPSACHNLSDSEIKEFDKYLDNLRNNVVGQGKIMKYQSPKMLKENYIQDSSVNMVASSEDYQHLKPQGAEVKGHLTVDKVSGYNAFSQPYNSESYPVKDLLNSKPFKYSSPISSYGVDFQPLRSKPLEKNENINMTNHNLNVKSYDKNLRGPKPFFPTDSSQQKDLKRESHDNLTGNQGYQNNPLLRTPSSFINKKFPAQDKQNNNANIFQHDDNYNEKPQGFLCDGTLETMHRPSSVASSESLGAKNNWSQGGRGNAFEPAPYDASISRNPLANFETLNISSSEVPFVPVQETGNIKAPKRLASDSLSNKTTEELEDSSESFPTPPATCQQCLEVLYPDEIVVQTERAGNLALWHAKCFVCETCKELLVDLMYFFHKGKVYCGRHYSEMMKIPRCHACDELIFVKEYTCAEGESYHFRHFCCFLCDQPLGGKQYIPKDNQAVCLDCYQAKYGKNCRTCSLPIKAGEQRISWNELDFHVSPECFRCTNCLKSMLGGKFLVKNLKIFCSKECVQQFVD